jgi:hypothetical protein
MPVSTRSKAKAGKRGAKTTRDSASEKKAKTTRGRLTAAERCAKRLARQSRARRDARDERYLTLGEQVLRNPLIRDLSIRGLNPYKLSELQSVLGLREFYKLLPDVDLKECYFEGAWGFRKDEFVLANWREMSVEEMKEKVRGRIRLSDIRGYVYPPGKVDVDTLETKEEIVRAFWELTYVPRRCTGPLSAVRTCCGWSRPGTSGRIRMWLMVSVVGVSCWSGLACDSRAR